MRRKKVNRRRGIRISLFCAVLGLISTLGLNAAAQGQSRQVENQEQFFAALADQTVEVIELTKEINILTEDGSDKPLIIDRDVTIKGNALTLRRAGIILGGNVTFEEMTIQLANPVRNAIFANGYTLTLKNVRQKGSSQNHLFCGGISDYTSSGTLPDQGSAGKIIISGTNNAIGNIYAGNLDDAPNEGAAKENTFTGSASIVIQADAEGTFGTIYAHGAREARGEGTDSLYPDAQKYKVDGGVSITLNNSKIKQVDGATGGTENAAVVYQDNGKGYLYTPVLENVGSLSLNSGTSKAQVELGAKSKNIGSVKLAKNTSLDVSSLGNVSLSGIEGEGTLILGSNQTIDVTGTVKGTITLAIDGVNADGSSSTGTIALGHPYLKAPKSTGEQIILLPSAVVQSALEKNAAGEWLIPSEEEAILIQEIAMEPIKVAEGVKEAIIPVTKIRYTTEEIWDSLGFIPMNILVDNSDAVRKNEDGSYYYTAGVGSKAMEFYFIGNQEGTTSEALYIKGAGTNPIGAGEYQFTFQIPKAYMQNKQDHQLTVTLTVGEKAASSDTNLPEDEITVAAGGIQSYYNGSAFSLSTIKGTHFSWRGTGTASITGYYVDEGTTLTTGENSGSATQGGAPVNAGTYYAKVAIGADETYQQTVRLIPFTIQKAELEVQSLPVVSPIVPGQSLQEAKIYNGIVAIKGSNTAVNGTWMWTNGTIQPEGNGTYAAKFHPTAGSNFQELGEQKLSVTVSENLGAYRVEYKPGEGSGTMTNGTAIEGTPFVLPESKFTPPTGKVFAGWQIEGKDYMVGSAVIFTKNTEVTAVWKIAENGNTNTGDQNGNTNTGSQNGNTNTGSQNGSTNTGGQNGNTNTGSQNGSTNTGSQNGNTNTGSQNGNTNTGGQNGNTNTGSQNGNTNTGNQNNQHSGGNTGSSSQSSGTQQPTTISAYGTRNTVMPIATLSGSIVTVNALNQNEVQKVLTDHTDKNPITFDVSKMGKAVTGVSLSRENLKTFADSPVNGGLRIVLASGTVSLDSKGLKAIAGQSDGDQIRLVLNNGGTSVLNEKQQRSSQTMQIHGATEIYFLSVKDNRRISDLQGGIMTISVPFTIPAGHSSGNFFVWYIDENGDRTKLNSWYEGYKLHWQVGHNSAFIISYGNPQVVLPANTTIKSPKTGDAGLDTLFQDFTIFVFGTLVIPVLTISLLVILYFRRKLER